MKKLCISALCAVMTMVAFMPVQNYAAAESDSVLAGGRRPRTAMLFGLLAAGSALYRSVWPAQTPVLNHDSVQDQGSGVGEHVALLEDGGGNYQCDSADREMQDWWREYMTLRPQMVDQSKPTPFTAAVIARDCFSLRNPDPALLSLDEATLNETFLGAYRATRAVRNERIACSIVELLGGSKDVGDLIAIYALNAPDLADKLIEYLHIPCTREEFYSYSFEQFLKKIAIKRYMLYHDCSYTPKRLLVEVNGEKRIPNQRGVNGEITEARGWQDLITKLESKPLERFRLQVIRGAYQKS